MHDSDAMIAQRMARLERRLRIAQCTAVLGVAFGLFSGISTINGQAVASSAKLSISKVPDVLTVRQLNIVDANGTTRVKIGSPLPTAVVDGKKLRSRGGRPQDSMSGILLFDATGQERSGYATVDRGYSNVLLTLDDENGRQHAMFIAEPGGATTLRLFNADTKDRVDVGIREDGPLISMVRDGKPFYEVTPDNERPARSKKE